MSGANLTQAPQLWELGEELLQTHPIGAMVGRGTRDRDQRRLGFADRVQQRDGVSPGALLTKGVLDLRADPLVSEQPITRRGRFAVPLRDKGSPVTESTSRNSSSPRLGSTVQRGRISVVLRKQNIGQPELTNCITSLATLRSSSTRPAMPSSSSPATSIR